MVSDAAFLNGADLQGLDLHEADLNPGNLSHVNLRGANLSSADLSWADIRGSNLKGAKYNEHTKFPPEFDPEKAGMTYVGKPTTLEKAEMTYKRKPTTKDNFLDKLGWAKNLDDEQKDWVTFWCFIALIPIAFFAAGGQLWAKIIVYPIAFIFSGSYLWRMVYMTFNPDDSDGDGAFSWFYRRPSTATKSTYTRRSSQSDYPDNWEALRQAVLARDGRMCGNCQSHTGPFHVHHIVPLSRGGTNLMTNLRVLCEDCHKSIHPHMR
jgi:hypothetical protein